MHDGHGEDGRRVGFGEFFPFIGVIAEPAQLELVHLRDGRRAHRGNVDLLLREELRQHAFGAGHCRIVTDLQSVVEFQQRGAERMGRAAGRRHADLFAFDVSQRFDGRLVEHDELHFGDVRVEHDFDGRAFRNDRHGAC